MDIRKIAIIFVIGALFAILAFSTIDAVITNPREEYCKYDYERPVPMKLNADSTDCPDYSGPTEEELMECSDNKGYIIYEYDDNGCPYSHRCSCRMGYADAVKRYSLIVFILYTAFATIGVSIGIFLPLSKNPLHEWVGTGFMLGGFICLFIGTAQYFGDMNKVLRPIVILLEMALIIFFTYRKLGDIREKKEPGKKASKKVKGRR